MKGIFVVLAILVVVGSALAPPAHAKDDPIVLIVRSDAGELVIEGLNLCRDDLTEPSLTLGDRILEVTAFSSTLVRALMPDPPLGPGTYLLTVDATKDKIGMFELTFSAGDVSCTGCVSESELDFDPATQSELDAEEAARIAADEGLQADLDAEEAARIAADEGLQADLDAEEAARIAGDDDISGALASETTQRAAADAANLRQMQTEMAAHVVDEPHDSVAQHATNPNAHKDYIFSTSFHSCLAGELPGGGWEGEMKICPLASGATFCALSAILEWNSGGPEGHIQSRCIVSEDSEGWELFASANLGWGIECRAVCF